jgi:type IV pilus assembly protein PilX
MRRTLHRPKYRQRGVVLIFSLIILLILTIGAVALMRSMNTSLFSAGNLAFRRDLMNQGELAVSNVMTQFKIGGGLSTSAVTTASVPALNYSALALTTNSQGIPNALLNNATFATVGTSANDITTGASADVVIRYVIDRLCTTAGTSTGTLCVQSSASPPGGLANGTQALPPPSATVYRLSVRVIGPRSTQVFLQTTFTRQD